MFKPLGAVDPIEFSEGDERGGEFPGAGASGGLYPGGFFAGLEQLAAGGFVL